MIGMIGRAVISIAVALSAHTSFAQQPQQAKPLQFEAAAIRPGTPQRGVDSSTSGGSPGGQFRMVNMPLKQWVEMGLSVQDYALKSPSWLDTSRFDLNAKLPNQPVTQTSMAEMMRTLLIERFGLRWHEEQQTVSGYELVTDKKVLVQSASLMERLMGAHGEGHGNGVINGVNMSMSELAKALGNALGGPVVDATHLSGGYDIKMTWRPPDDDVVASERQSGKQYGVDVDNLPGSIFTALREQLGLRLQPTKVPSKVIAVDHINSQPTAN
jgi:uncharacterized protein (TIGR03435 family)